MATPACPPSSPRAGSKEALASVLLEPCLCQYLLEVGLFLKGVTVIVALCVCVCICRDALLM